MSDPTPVTVQGFTWGAAAGWSTFLLIAGAIAGLFRALGPAKLYEIWVSRDKTLRDERRVEGVGLTEQVAALSKRVSTAESNIVYVTTAFTMVIDRLRVLSPDDPTIDSAMKLIEMAASADDGYGGQLAKLANLPGTKGKP